MHPAGIAIGLDRHQFRLAALEHKQTSDFLSNATVQRIILDIGDDLRPGIILPGCEQRHNCTVIEDKNVFGRGGKSQPVGALTHTRWYEVSE
jgi:hypothetical protein